MKTPTIAYFGLSRLQIQTLKCHFPQRCRFVELQSDYFEEKRNIVDLANTEGCVFINPKKLRAMQLAMLIASHNQSIVWSHMTILLFTSKFTEEQLEIIDPDSLNFVNLSNGRDPNLINVTKIIGKARIPCFNSLDKIKYNMFNDGWYLVDFETTGLDPFEDEIISFSIAYMANYEIKSTESYYINSTKPITKNIEELTGITNDMLSEGISGKELVEKIESLPSHTPLILYSESYFVPFLKALFLRNGKVFDKSYVTLEELSAHVFGYLNCRKIYDILPRLQYRDIVPCSSIENKYLYNLYDLTLATFESLQERYHIRSVGELTELY